jgi:hypothetical protein
MSATFRVLAAASVVLTVGLTSACGGPNGPSAALDKPTASPTRSVTPTEEPSGKATRPPDPLATDVPALKRPGAKPASQRVTSTPAAFSGQVRYSDGVVLEVLSIAQGASTGKGPGVFVGSPRTALTVKVTNGTGRVLKLEGVVVTLRYGSPQRMASPVYEDAAHDLAGTVAPGKSATAVYMFSIPTKELTKVTMSVDFDGTHAAAVFRGSVKS